MNSNHLTSTIYPEPRADAVENALASLESLKFDCIAVRGISGISIGSIVAFQLKKNLAIVRKPNEKFHAPVGPLVLVESPEAVIRYVVIDDFVSSGETLYHIQRNMLAIHPNSLCVGMVMYNRIGGFYNEIWVGNAVRNFIHTNPELAILEDKIV